MSRKTLIPLLLAAACGKASSNRGVPADVQQHVELVQAASCDSLAQNVRDIAVRQMRAELDAEKNWSWCCAFPGGGVAGTPQASGSAPASYTTTNTQVAG